nr:uncharacterized protein LOC105348674 isoform X3 [Crassostrea gigas]
MDNCASMGADRLLSDEQIHQFITSTVLPHHRSLTRNGPVHQFITSTVLPHHRSLTRNESQVSEVYPETEVATSNYRRPEIDTTTLPVKSGTYKVVEPTRNQFLPNVVHTVLQNTELEPTRTVERMAQRWANQLLSDEKIHQFIESTVLPHHRRLTNPHKSSFTTNQKKRPINCEEKFNRQCAVVTGPPVANNLLKRAQTENQVVPGAIPAHQRGLLQEIQRQATGVLKEIHIPETNNVIQEMQVRTTRVSYGGSEILGIPREIQRECSEETCVPCFPEIVSVLHEIPGETIWDSPETVDVRPEMHEEVVVAPLKDIETQRTQYDVSVPQREDQKEESSSHIQGQSTKVLLQATANVKQTRRKQKLAKWTALIDKVKHKHKTLVSCRKKAKKIPSLRFVRKSHKFSRRYIRKIPQRVTTSGKKTTSHKKVTLQNDGQNGELVENDVKKFLKKFSQDKLNISPREPSEFHVSVNPSPWDPEHIPVSIDRHSRQDLTGSEHFLPCQDCYIDLDLFL